MAVFTFKLILFLFFLLFHTISYAVDRIGASHSIRDGETLVSKHETFELGFFSPGNSKYRYVGIWYKNIPHTVVWVANGCHPINDSSGLLMINNIGNLVILYRNMSVVWTTSSSKQAQKAIVELLDSGNLVIRDEKDGNSESYLWQSFDHPSDTWLSGMKLGWDFRTGLRRRLSAWKSWDDPCLGDFTYGIEYGPQLHTFPEIYMWKGTAKICRRGSWNGLGLSAPAGHSSDPIFDFDFVYNNDEVYYIYNLKNKSVISIVVLNQTTLIRQRLVWNQAKQTWNVYSRVPRDKCDNYSFCGPNGNCVITETPICQCLVGFKPKFPEKWNSMDWSEGCVQNNTLSCKHKDKGGFTKFSGMKVPDSSSSWMAENLNLDECRAICLNNCSCMAYTNSNIRGKGSGCIMWFGDLIDIRTYSTGGQDLFIRVPHSETEGKDDRKMKAVVVAVTGGVLVMLLLGYCIYRRGSKGIKNKVTQNNRANEEDLELPLLELSTIVAATNNFSQKNELGQGGFGSVYRGKLENGQEIAVKRLSLSSHQGIKEFENEVILTAKLQHRNLVKLLGCCIQGEEKLLIYEYMPNKSLDFFIFDQQQSKPLEWPKRFEILCGIARGLQYLHQDSRLRIVHRDLKASNILLDDKMNPKISDLGIAKTFGGDQTEGKTNTIAGTRGYLAPEYVFNGLFSTKSDVFSFGIMVLEIISGKRSMSFHQGKHDLTLMGHAWTLLNEGRPFELIDLRLRVSCDDLQQVLRCMHIGLLCVQQHPIDRPDMSSVILMLGSDSELPYPKPPGYFMGTDSPERKCVSRRPNSFSKNTMTVTTFGGR